MPLKIWPFARKGTTTVKLELPTQEEMEEEAKIKDALIEKMEQDADGYKERLELSKARVRAFLARQGQINDARR